MTPEEEIAHWRVLLNQQAEKSMEFQIACIEFDIEKTMQLQPMLHAIAREIAQIETTNDVFRMILNR